ncbi:MAG: diguanylate cyclase [Planctomycetota bacterium]|jgi:diguanylate cyclase (GGDEF)-like protein/putative nucleotidyltransferase with HDIG domain
MYEVLERPSEIITINHNSSIKTAADIMFTNKVSCLIVNNDDGDFIGLVTERDIVNRVVASSMDIEKTTISQIMSTQIISCSPNTPSSEVREIMTVNQIRHLPIIDDGSVVGILSTRDLMARQLLEDRAAAEEVAMLSTCLKSIDLNEVAEIVTHEVPKLFQAEKCVLFIRRDDSTNKTSSLIRYNNCSCPKKSLEQLKDIPQLSDGAEFHYDDIPFVCEKLGAKSPRLVIPLNVSPNSFTSTSSNSAKGQKPNNGDCYLCICSLASSIATNKELTSYKARLAREILNSHLTNAKLYQEARLTSLTDTLTLVGSRKLLEDKLQAEFARSQRYKRTFSLAIIDLDNFKTINDILGHGEGDEALKNLAECMKSQIRTTDILTRYGGDEFVVLMPETKAADSVKLLERIRDKIQKIELMENLPMTISCGIAESLSEPTDSSREVLRRADLALYEAKSAGRNCVKAWDKTMSKALNNNDIENEKIKKLQRRIAGLSEQAERVFIQSIWGLVQALEAKDSYTKKHSENVMHYAVGIAKAMEIPSEQINVIRRAAMIHDIGKIGIPDAILSKPGKLTPHERRIIEQHPVIAVRILEKMTFLEQEIAIIKHHHEKWNGQGYPDGLSNPDIPLGALIMAAADTLDALTSNRPYHQVRSLDEAIEILVDSSGYDYAPKVVLGIIAWVDSVRNQKGKSQLTIEDLLDSQKQLNKNFMSPLITCETTH